MTTANDPAAVVRAVGTALEASPAFRALDPATRRELTGSLDRIGGYVGEGSRAPVDPRPQPVSRSTAASGGSVGRVGEVARATLNAIDFPSFVAALVKGTFQAIVDATIQQMEAYATLLQEVAKTVDDYMRDNVTDDAAKDYLVDRYSDVFHKDTTTGSAALRVDRTRLTEPLPTFFQDLGFETSDQLDPDSVEQVVVPAVRRSIAEQRHQTLATMVLLGLNRIVVNDGEINAKLQFHIDASETTGITFDSTRNSLGTLAGGSTRSRFSGQGIMVNTASVNAQSDINLRTDLTGEVKVRFSTDYLPLERFADSNAIQLINEHATVPVTERPQAPEAPNGAAPAPPAQPQPQSLPARPPSDDPWSPRS
ncbi:hypothetical protein [Streptomyces sp. HUAS ZL42]|uniref:hypothetical protein n=1 Tax=Streptomyces sp. HUAS ZL42 TaxID=3231715 RepID=UPI00345E11FA